MDAFPSHCRLVWRLGTRASHRRRKRFSPRSRANMPFPSEKAISFSPRAPTGSNSAPTAAMPFSTTRPENRRPNCRSAAGWRRSSLWKRQFCAKAASPALPPDRYPRSAMCGSRVVIRRASRRSIKITEGHARHLRRYRPSEAHRHREQIHCRRRTISLARPSDVEKTLRRVRPPCARQGMGGLGR